MTTFLSQSQKLRYTLVNFDFLVADSSEALGRERRLEMHQEKKDFRKTVTLLKGLQVMSMRDLKRI